MSGRESIPSGVTRDWLVGYAEAAWDYVDGLAANEQAQKLVEAMAEPDFTHDGRWAEGYAAGMRRAARSEQARRTADSAVKKAVSP